MQDLGFGVVQTKLLLPVGECFRCAAGTPQGKGNFFFGRPALSSDKALGFTTRSLHQCCRAQYSHPIHRVAERQTWICACREY